VYTSVLRSSAFVVVMWYKRDPDLLFS